MNQTRKHVKKLQIADTFDSGTCTSTKKKATEKFYMYDNASLISLSAI